MKLIRTINRSMGCKARVYFDDEYSEYRVKFWDCDNQRLSNADYFTDCPDDAYQTAIAELDRMVNAETI